MISIHPRAQFQNFFLETYQISIVYSWKFPTLQNVWNTKIRAPFFHVFLQRYKAFVVLLIINTNDVIPVNQQTYLQNWQDSMMVKIYIWTLTNTVVDKACYYD